MKTYGVHRKGEKERQRFVRGTREEMPYCEETVKEIETLFARRKVFDSGKSTIAQVATQTS